MTPRPGLWLSLALHGALVLVLIALTVESSPRVLFVDLLHGRLPGSPAPSQGSPAGVDAAAPRRVAALGAPQSRGGARVPSPPAAPAAPSPEATATSAPAAPVETPIATPPRVPTETAAARVDVTVVEARSPTTGGSGSGVPGGGLTGSGGAESTGIAGAATGGAGGGGRSGPGGLEGGRGAAAALRSGDAPGGGGLEYEGYYRLIRSRIQEAIEYPRQARRRGLTGTVVIEIDVGADGTIGRVTLAGSSSHGLLDEAVLEAARGLGRTPFPAGLRPRPLRMQLPIVFDLR